MTCSSRFGIDDIVLAEVRRSRVRCRVVAVTFTKSKVLYDLDELDELDDGERHERVDSAFVHAIEHQPETEVSRGE